MPSRKSGAQVPAPAAAAAAVPSPPKLPSPGTGDIFNETQWAVLLSLLDAAIPPLVPESEVKDPAAQLAISDAQLQDARKLAASTMVHPPSEEALAAYLADRPSSYPGFVHGVRQTLSNAPAPARKQLGAVLFALSTAPGSLVLTGYSTPVHRQPLSIRHAILQAWDKSWLSTPHLLLKTFTMMARACWVQHSPIFQQITQYPDFLEGYKPGPAVDFRFLQFPSAAEPAELETDIIIVGSGPGGGVCAKVLSEAGHRVLVVDKGYYFPPSQLPMPQATGMAYLYENSGVLSSADSSINTVAGSCWGGGGTVNWSVSLQTQGYVRREWAEQHGLPFFASAEFQKSLDRVCDFVGAAHPARQSHRGQVLLDGAQKLGWHAMPCPQNSGGHEHWCGHCHLGCGGGEKQGPAVSWLPAAQKAGAQFIEGLRVDRILWDESGRKKTAVGVVGTWTSRDADGSVSGPAGERTTREVVIKAKKVIISSGSLNSPLLLDRSGLTNRHIGRNLHLHPVNFVAGFWDEDVKPWEGGIITSLVSSFEDLDGQGHGVKLETSCMMPYTILPMLGWKSGLDFKLTAMRYRHMNAFIALTRDRDTGRVYADAASGRPVVDYTPSAFDSAHTLEGVVALAKICYITGAREIHAMLPGLEPFVRAQPAETQQQDDEAAEMDLGVSDPAFVEWIGRVRAAGNARPYSVFSSAHQMGTCRMSSHAGDGVVDPRGKVWGTEGLYVADASVFPSASGVNPMVTNMAIADWIARGVSGDIHKGQ
ncbi:GMC oxidoreductase [Thozetella sp. PMI_491]|nr:GMC oxidoreductase [Thozetella sp. PMI_491]